MGRNWLFILFLAMAPYNAAALQNVQMGILPSLNVNKKLPKDWSLHVMAASRQIFFRETFDYSYSLTDVSLIAATRIRLRTTIGGGYLARITEEGVGQRAIQQISFARSYASMRLLHRIAMDQTFVRQEDPEYRLRYRLSAEIPLEGQSLDPREFFLKLSNEYLNALQGKAYDLEVRTTALIGYALSTDTKLEMGFDYRADEFVKGPARSRLWVGLNLFHAI